MVEFNPDGSIKLPGKMAKRVEDNISRMRSQRCLKVKREILNHTAPKKCCLHITLSDAITDNRFIENIYQYFTESTSTPTSLRKLSEKEFDVIIDTDFRRCSDCTSLINRYREQLDDNLIDEKGSCTFENRKGGFSYEDYFD